MVMKSLGYGGNGGLLGGSCGNRNFGGELWLDVSMKRMREGRSYGERLGHCICLYNLGGMLLLGVWCNK